MNAIGAARCSGRLVSMLLAGAGVACVSASGARHDLSTLVAPDDWAAYGHDMGGGQYSPLTDLNTRNVAGLKRVWTHTLPDRGSTGVTPIFVNDRIYYCSQQGKAVAVDPVTGKELWRADPYAPGADGKAISGNGGRQSGCRAVTYWAAAKPVAGAVCERRIFWGDGNSQTYAVDALTGEFCRDFGASKGHPGYVSNQDFDNHGQGLGKAVSPGAVVGDTLITTQGVSDPLAVEAADGYVRAWDVRSGELRWDFDPVPVDKRDVAGAGNVWSTISADPELGLVYIPTTSFSPDYYGGARLIDESLADTLLAIEVKTGKIVWRHTLVRHDLWDYDLPGHPLLSTITKNGVKRYVAIQQTKMGYVYVFDRKTGESLFPMRDIAAPPSSVPGERASPTQPSSTVDVFARQSFTRDEIFGLTPEDRAACQASYDVMRHGPIFEPPSLEGTILMPGNGGGGNVGGQAFDPNTNLLIIRSTNAAMVAKLIPRDRPAGSKPPGVVYAGVPYDSESLSDFWLSPMGAPCTPPPWVTLSAINMDSGKIVWQRPWGQAVRFGGKAYANAPLEWGATNVFGGPIVTAGGLIFMAGTEEGRLRALDITTGKELWSDQLPAPANTVPITFRSHGRQYVVLTAAGYGMAAGVKPSIVAYALK